ncbi:MAG: hypothetical protein ACTSX7_01775 [Alphaproteobacteria bacterium]
MSEHRYPMESLTGDYLRAAAGVVFCGGPLILVDVGRWPLIVLGGLTVLFTYFGYRTWLRHTTLLTIDDTRLATHSVKPPHVPWQNASLPWPDLQRYKLSYFSTKRDKTGGWMQLTLRGKGRKFQIDSAIDGFDDVARQAFHAAHRNKVQFSDTTLGNLGAIGIEDTANKSGGWGDPANWDAPDEIASPDGPKP